MTTRKSWLVGLAVLGFLAIGILAALLPSTRPEGAQPDGTRPGPSIFEIDLENVEGVAVKLADYKGDILVVNFWATWCFPCRMEIPDFIELTKRYKERGVRVLGIAIDESNLEAVKKFAYEIGINYPVLVGDRAVAEAFGGVFGFPSTFLVSRDGAIYSRYNGLAPKAQIEQDIRYLLAEHP